MVMSGIEVTSIRMLIHTPSTRLLHARMNFESGCQPVHQLLLVQLLAPLRRGAKLSALNP